MGWNTTIVISNDSLHEIAKDKEFGKSVSDAASKFMCARGAVSTACGRASVVAENHADDVRLILVGWYTGVAVGGASGRPSDPGTQLRALKDAARGLGYKLHRIPKRREEMTPHENREAARQVLGGALKAAGRAIKESNEKNDPLGCGAVILLFLVLFIGLM